MDSRANSGAEAPTEVGWKSMPDLMVPAVDDHRSNMLKPLESSDVRSLPSQLKICMSLPNMAVRENSSGDAPKIGLSSVTSAEFVVSMDSPSQAESSVFALMPPANAEDDCWIETPLSVSSPSPPISAGVTDKVTSCSGRSDAGTDLAESVRQAYVLLWCDRPGRRIGFVIWFYYDYIWPPNAPSSPPRR